MKGSVFSVFFSLSLGIYKNSARKNSTLGDQIRTRTQREWPRYRASRNVLDVYTNNNCRGHVRVKTNKRKQSGDKHDPGGIQMIGDKQNSEYSSIDFTCTQHAQSGRSSPAPPPSIFATRATLTSFGTLAFLCTSRLVSNKHTHPAGAKARFFIIINIYHRAAPVAFVRRMDLGRQRRAKDVIGVGRSRNERVFFARK